MFANKLFLIFFGCFYGGGTTLFSIFLTKFLFCFFEKYIKEGKIFFLKVVILFSTFLFFLFFLFLFIYVSWIFPIVDEFWSFFSTPYKFSIFFTLIFYFKENRSRR